MYVSKNPYKFKKALVMHERCSHCQTKFKIEPSFFYGAMYVSYGLGVALAVATFVISYFFIGLSRLESFFAITGTLIVLMPVILRLSRNIWINFFFHYDAQKAKK